MPDQVPPLVPCDGAVPFVVQVRRDRVVVRGELDMATSDELLEAVEVASVRGERVNLDLGDVSFVDSYAIRTMVLLGRERTVVIVAASSVVDRVLHLVGLAEEFGRAG